MARYRRILICFVLAATMVPAAMADEVSDQIREALKAYERHDLSTAAAALDAASNLVRQAKADIWKSMMPDPLPGWSAGEVESTVVATAILGGGTSVSRRYKKGSQSVEVSFIADSPVIQGIGPLISSGLITGTDSKVLVIDGRRVTYTRNENSYSAMVGKVMVTVKGQADDNLLRAYWSAIRFGDLEKMSSS